MKKILSLMLCAFIIFQTTLPVFAVDDIPDSELIDEDVQLFATSYATLKYPKWPVMQDMIAKTLALDPAYIDDVTYTIDSFVILVGKTNTYDSPEEYKDTAKIYLYCWDSVGTKVEFQDTRMYISEQSNDVGQIQYCFWHEWNYDTMSWQLGGTTNSINIRENGILYAHKDLPKWGSSGGTFMTAGYSDLYYEVLLTDESLEYDPPDDEITEPSDPTYDLTETNTILMSMLFLQAIYVSSALWTRLLGR